MQTRALPIKRFTLQVSCPIQMTVTRLACWIIIVSKATRITVRGIIFLFTFTTSCALGTVSSRIIVITVACYKTIILVNCRCCMKLGLTLADICFVPVLIIWSVIGRLTLVAVYAFCIVLAVLAYTSTLIPSMYVQGQTFLFHFWIIYAFIAVLKTVASCI